MELTEHNDTPVDAASEGDELDDLFLSPEDSEGEIVAEVAPTGDIASDDTDAAPEADPAEPPVIEMDAEPVAAPVVDDGALDEANEKIKALEEERDEVKNRMMRVAADLENFRKRAAREREDLRKYGIDKVVLELLPVLDNLERALQHAEANAEDNSITEGVRMVYRQFNTALGKHGVTGFDSKGEKFDPQRHEAIQQVETDEFETGTVMEEYQKGYFLHERLIRPAMVSVAKNVTGAATSGEDGSENGGDSEVDAAEDETSSDEEVIDITPNDESSEGSSEGVEESSAASGSAPSEDSEGLEESTDVGM